MYVYVYAYYVCMYQYVHVHTYVTCMQIHMCMHVLPSRRRTEFGVEAGTSPRPPGRLPWRWDGSPSETGGTHCT